jgi:hypothetical protein
VACCSNFAKVQQGKQRLDSRKRGMRGLQDMRLFIVWSEELRCHKKELKGFYVLDMAIECANRFLRWVDKRNLALR